MIREFAGVQGILKNKSKSWVWKDHFSGNRLKHSNSALIVNRDLFLIIQQNDSCLQHGVRQLPHYKLMGDK